MDIFTSEHVREVALSGIRVYNALARETPGCIPLTIGEPDFNTPDCIKNAAKAALDNNFTHYPPNNGEEFLRQAISDFERERNGFDYSPDEVVVTVGATGAIFTALVGIINPGDEIIVPTPAYVLYENVVKLCGGVFVPMDTAADGFQITPERLSRAATHRTKAIILNSPNNPTGCILNEESLQAVYDFAKERDIFVICDDVYSQLVYDKGYKSFAAYSELKDKILLVQSFSKPYAMTGWRVGYLCAEKSVLQQLQKVHQNSTSSIVSFVQSACVTALSADVSEMRETYRARRDFIYSRLTQMGFEVYRPEGAFYIFPSIEKFKMDSGTFSQRLITEGGVGTIPSSCFGSEGFIRLSYCYSQAELEEGLSRIERFIGTL